MAHSPQAPSILLMALLMAIAATTASAHGWMSKPKPRNMVLGENTPGNWKLTGANGKGSDTMPKVGGYKYRNNPCGDPFEEITPPTNFGAQPTPVQAEYNAGDTIDLTVNLNANHGGYFEFRLCGQKTGLTNECFEANKLERADIPGETKYWILNGDITKSRYTTPDTYNMKYKLPEGFVCEDGCVLQWWWRCQSECAIECDPKICGFYAEHRNEIVSKVHAIARNLPVCPERPEGNSEVFANCADVRIVSSGAAPLEAPGAAPEATPAAAPGAKSPAPAPAPAATPAPAPKATSPAPSPKASPGSHEYSNPKSTPTSAPGPKAPSPPPGPVLGAGPEDEYRQSDEMEECGVENYPCCDEGPPCDGDLKCERYDHDPRIDSICFNEAANKPAAATPAPKPTAAPSTPGPAAKPTAAAPKPGPAPKPLAAKPTAAGPKPGQAPVPMASKPAAAPTTHSPSPSGCTRKSCRMWSTRRNCRHFCKQFRRKKQGGRGGQQGYRG